MYKLIKEFEICCSHRLYEKSYTDEQNLEVFGKCANTPSHGHNYIVSVELSGNCLHIKNGMLMNFNKIKEVFKKEIDDVYDHKFLNDCPGFKNKVPTAENMAELFFKLLIIKIPILSKVTIQETQGARASYDNQ